MIDRCTIGFANPNHAAAMICALLPLCWGCRRTAWLGRVLTGVLFVALLLTLSRTGLIVAGLEIVAWLWCGRLVWKPLGTGHELSPMALDLARMFFDAVAENRPCAVWGEDDVRRILPKERIDVEFRNPLYNARLAAMWRE